MLLSTFIHIPKITKRTENFLWSNSVNSWNDFLKSQETINLPEKKKLWMQKFLNFSLQNFEVKNHEFFTNLLPANQHWRAYPEFKEKCCYLDIETTGLSKHRNMITTIGIHDEQGSRVLIHGKDLHTFPDVINEYGMIVTFNGKCFDLPFIKEKFPDIEFNQFHVDLRFVLKKLGYSGGLKRIEKEIGISRDDDISEVDGYEAVRLWKRYEKGDIQALDTLVKYNIADVENLKILMELAYEKSRETELGC